MIGCFVTNLYAVIDEQAGNKVTQIQICNTKRDF